MNRNLLLIAALGLVSLDAAETNQQAIFRADTRVVTVDAMVEDAKTRLPIDNLTRANFRLKIDGKEREITYFGRDGVERRPLALLVYLNLAPDGGLRDLSRQPALASFRDALQRLSPEDEVAVFAANDWFVGEAKEMTALTKDRDAAAAAIKKAIDAALTASEEDREADRAGREKSMTAAIEKARRVGEARPRSQVAMVYISDGMNTLDTMESRGRRRLAEALQRHNISFSALDVRMMEVYANAAAVLNPIGFAFGLSVTGSSDFLAKQSGGVAVDVPNPAELGPAFERVMSSYVTRYSLGYQLTEGEYSSGRLHRIEVSLAGDAAKGRNVTHRRAFATNPTRR